MSLLTCLYSFDEISTMYIGCNWNSLLRSQCFELNVVYHLLFNQFVTSSAYSVTGVIFSDNTQEALISGPTRRKLTPEAIDTNITTDSLSLDPTDVTDKVCAIGLCFDFPQQSQP